MKKKEIRKESKKLLSKKERKLERNGSREM